MSKKPKQSEVIKTLKEEVQNLQDKYVRLIAEFDNYKKRTTREKTEFAQYANENIIKSFLPIIDDFERAKKNQEKNITGYQLIEQKIIDILTKQKLQKINITKNETFDLEKHEAISSIPVKNKKQKDKIVDEIEAGYKIGDKIIRYPKVIIGK
tara:strand:+ start:827 stop:1285 length:459 start_codon:yes stop_codon:yes gene_type:complete